jgi:hypothetical protein
MNTPMDHLTVPVNGPENRNSHKGHLTGPADGPESLAVKQEPLGEPFTKVLRENLWNLYSVSTSAPHGFKPGELIRITTPDMRWWRRLWHFLTFRAPPQHTTTHTVGSVTRNTFEISPSP